MKSENVKNYLNDFVKEGKATLKDNLYTFTNCEIDYDYVHPQAIVKWILQYGK